MTDSLNFVDFVSGIMIVNDNTIYCDNGSPIGFISGGGR